IAAISAKSRKPDTESLGIDSRSVLASSRLQTGVLPFLTTYFGPRTECAGFDGVICRTTRKSYSIRTAASFCLMVGLDRQQNPAGDTKHRKQVGRFERHMSGERHSAQHRVKTTPTPYCNTARPSLAVKGH